MKSVTSIETANASRYLQQLCKHFAHKIETENENENENDERRGICRFPNFVATLAASEDRLDIELDAADDEALARGRDVIWSHLRRFAFREDLPEPIWQTGG